MLTSLSKPPSAQRPNEADLTTEGQQLEDGDRVLRIADDEVANRAAAGGIGRLATSARVSRTSRASSDRPVSGIGSGSGARMMSSRKARWRESGSDSRGPADGTDELGAGLAVLRLVLAHVEGDEVEAEHVELLDQRREGTLREATRLVLDQARPHPLEIRLHRLRIDVTAERAGLAALGLLAQPRIEARRDRVQLDAVALRRVAAIDAIRELGELPEILLDRGLEGRRDGSALVREHQALDQRLDARAVVDQDRLAVLLDGEGGDAGRDEGIAVAVAAHPAADAEAARGGVGDAGQDVGGGVVVAVAEGREELRRHLRHGVDQDVAQHVDRITHLVEGRRLAGAQVGREIHARDLGQDLLFDVVLVGSARGLAPGEQRVDAVEGLAQRPAQGLRRMRREHDRGTQVLDRPGHALRRDARLAQPLEERVEALLIVHRAMALGLSLLRDVQEPEEEHERAGRLVEIVDRHPAQAGHELLLVRGRVAGAQARGELPDLADPTGVRRTVLLADDLSMRAEQEVLDLLVDAVRFLLACHCARDDRLQ